jgi:hypothetical protein
MERYLVTLLLLCRRDSRSNIVGTEAVVLTVINVGCTSVVRTCEMSRESCICPIICQFLILITRYRLAIMSPT